MQLTPFLSSKFGKLVPPQSMLPVWLHLSSDTEDAKNVQRVVFPAVHPIHAKSYDSYHIRSLQLLIFCCLGRCHERAFDSNFGGGRSAVARNAQYTSSSRNLDHELRSMP